MKKLLLYITMFCLTFFSLNTNSFASSKTIDFSKPITGSLQKGSLSYKFDVTYTTDFMFVAYVGKSEKENDEYSNEYQLKVYDNKNKTVASEKIAATSKRMSFYNSKKKRYYVYQVINRQLKKGSYTLKISGSFKDKQKYSIYTDREVYGGTVKITSLTANVKSSSPVKKTITFSTKAKGSYLQYKYSVINKTKKTKEKIIRNYSSNKKVKWKPTVAGTYNVKVTVQNMKSGKTSSKMLTYKIVK